MPMPKKKPDYDPAKIMEEFFSAISDSYNHPTADEAVDGHKKMELVAEEFSISRLKVRKILITTGDYQTAQTREIKELRRQGKKTSQIAEAMQLAACTVTSLLPYEKTVYKMDEISVAAERTARYRTRKRVVEELAEDKESVKLWKAIIAFQNYKFVTRGRGSKDGVEFKYAVSEPGRGGQQYKGEAVDGYGNEIIIDGREKSISRSSVDYALKIALEEDVKGPKQLRIYGSSYVFAIFRRFGLV